MVVLKTTHIFTHLLHERDFPFSSSYDRDPDQRDSSSFIIMAALPGEEEEAAPAPAAVPAPGHRSLFSRVSTFGSDLVNALGDGMN